MPLYKKPVTPSALFILYSNSKRFFNFFSISPISLKPSLYAFTILYSSREIFLLASNVSNFFSKYLSESNWPVRLFNNSLLSNINCSALSLISLLNPDILDWATLSCFIFNSYISFSSYSNWRVMSVILL